MNKLKEKGVSPHKETVLDFITNRVGFCQATAMQSVIAVATQLPLWEREMEKNGASLGTQRPAFHDGGVDPDGTEWKVTYSLSMERPVSGNVTLSSLKICADVEYGDIILCSTAVDLWSRAIAKNKNGTPTQGDVVLAMEEIKAVLVERAVCKLS